MEHPRGGSQAQGGHPHLVSLSCLYSVSLGAPRSLKALGALIRQESGPFQETKYRGASSVLQGLPPALPWGANHCGQELSRGQGDAAHPVLLLLPVPSAPPHHLMTVP